MPASINTPWNAMWPMSPAMGEWPLLTDGRGLAAALGVDPLELATAGLETWRWLVNTQLDLAVATLSALRR